MRMIEIENVPLPIREEKIHWRISRFPLKMGDASCSSEKAAAVKQLLPDLLYIPGIRTDPKTSGGRADRYRSFP